MAFEIYTVQRGDSLSRIGARRGVPWRQILEDNREVLAEWQNRECAGPIALIPLPCPLPLPIAPSAVNPDLIFPGMALRIRVPDRVPKRDPAPSSGGGVAVAAGAGALALLTAAVVIVKRRRAGGQTSGFGQLARVRTGARFGGVASYGRE